jgi:hypothetical protein
LKTIQKLPFRIIKKDIFWISIFSFLFYYLLISAGGYLIDNDIFFHLKIADLYRQKLFLFKLPWEAYSIHADKYVDFHFLFHWLLVPFTFYDKNFLAGRSAAIPFLSTVSVIALYVLLKELKVEHRWLWILFFLLASPIFTGRLLFGRGFIIFLGIIFIFIFFFLRKNDIAVLIVSWIAVWTYPGFPVLAAFAAVYTFSSFVMKTGFFDKDLRCLAFSLCGMAAGITIHPSFPAQFYGYYLELVMQFIRPTDIEPIAEWLPPDPMIVKAGLLIPVIALVFRLSNIGKHSPLESTLLVSVVVIIISMTGSIKTYEYLIPFLTLYLALNVWDGFNAVIRFSFFFIIAVMMIFWSAPDLYSRISAYKINSGHEFDFETADWLSVNTEKDSLVLLSWSEFPEFFYRNDHNRYLFGLNPVYCYGYDKEKYLMIRSFFDGKFSDPTLISKTLNARYAVLNKIENQAAIGLISGKYPLIFQNNRFSVYKFF